MSDYNNILDLILENARNIFYPEEWLALDFAFSKSELFAMLLVERQGEVIMSQFADYLNIPMSTATGVIERLVKNGYLKRERSEADRRIVAIALTDKGRDLVTQLKNTLVRYVELIYDGLSEEERQLIFKVILKVINMLGRRPDEGKKDEETGSIKKIQIE